MKRTIFERTGFLASVLIAVIVIFASGFYLGHRDIPEVNKVFGISHTATQVTDADFETFWKAWNLLNERYVATHGKPAPNNQEKIYGAIQGLASAYGDPYTVFFPPVESSAFQAQIAGNFEGVGMEVGIQKEVLTVIAPLKNSPAERAGIVAGDQVLKIDDTVTNGLTVDAAVNLIRGKKGTVVKLLIFHKGAKAPVEIDIVRDTINIPTIMTEKKGDVFVIRLFSFTADSPNLFRNALREFIESGSTKLVLDLRSNPGGYLEAAVDMASWFLPPGKIIVREDYGGGQEEDTYRSKGYNVFNSNLRMAILVNEGSASASEILAGALSEHGVATLVGTKTFGKGSVQELLPVSGDTSLKITIARWLTPNGTSISDNGIVPDVIASTTLELVTAGKDPQLDAAIKVLNRR